MRRLNEIDRPARSSRRQPSTSGAHSARWLTGWPAAPTALLTLLALTLAACSTGDGKTLNEPDGTVPPITVPAPPIDEGSDTIGSVPLDAPTLPGDDTEILGTGLIVPAAASFDLTAPWFDGESIDPLHTCDGGNLSPSLSWTNPPVGTIELAVSVVDESLGGETPAIHWVIAGINPAERTLVEGAVPLGAVEGVNLFGNIGYDGPCPPPGDPAHVYRFTIHALGQQVELADGTPSQDLLGFVNDVSIESTDAIATYQR